MGIVFNSVAVIAESMCEIGQSDEVNVSFMLSLH